MALFCMGKPNTGSSGLMDHYRISVTEKEEILSDNAYSCIIYDNGSHHISHAGT